MFFGVTRGIFGLFLAATGVFLDGMIPVEIVTNYFTACSQF